MTIKKIVKNSSQTTLFKINKENALLVLTTALGTDCLFLHDCEGDEIQKLRIFNDVLSIKYIGGEQILKTIKELDLNWPDFKREVVVQNELDVIFYSESGKVRVAKQNLTQFPSLNLEEKKKVLIIDDSPTIQKLLHKIISCSSTLEVLGVANNPIEAMKFIEKDVPDLITLDIHMPEMNGVDFLKSYLGKKNIPTVIVSSVSIHEGPLVLEALSHGALTYIQKPTINKISEVKDEILEQLESIAKNNWNTRFQSSVKTHLEFESLDGLIVIGSSTGGTQALQEIFTSLPDTIPPIVVVQHIPAVFSKALADRLNTLCHFIVREAVDGDIVTPNNIYIAPGGKQIKIVKKKNEMQIVINNDPPVNRFKPSVDYLFDSIPELHEKNLMGVILTGMGKDGAKGLLKIKEVNGVTIAQDQKTSAVFGMPKEAISIGAAEHIVALPEIANTLVKEFNKNVKKKAA